MMNMKKAIALLLALCVLGTLCACQNNPAENTTDNTTETTAPPIVTDVAEPLTWDTINAIPLANNDMSEDELRKICLDFMTLMMRFAWTPSEQTNLKNQGKWVKTFVPGYVYGGTPYITGQMGNIYTVMEYYDEETGILDLSGGMNTIAKFANQCSGSVFWSWNRVCNSARYTNTADMTEANGCLRVGPYTYSKDLTDFLSQNIGTDQICKDNGAQTMYESYALVKPADGIVQSFFNVGHVRMISGTPKIVRDSKGKIDGTKSTVTYTDQDGQYYRDLQSNNVPYHHVGGYNVEITFEQLFKDGYIPFTFAELNKDKPVTKSETTLSHTDKTATVEQLKDAVVRCNYSISDITYVIKDASGKQVYRKLYTAYNVIGIQLREQRLSLFTMDPKALSEFADGNHTIEISVRIGTGEKPVVYTGTLVG